MKKSRFTEEQIAFALRQAESGVAVNEVCRKTQISQQILYRCKKCSTIFRVPLKDVDAALPDGIRQDTR